MKFVLGLVLGSLVVASLSHSQAQVHRASKVQKLMATHFLDEIARLHEMEDAMLETTLRSYMERKKSLQVKKDSVRHRRFRQRKSWARFESNLTDR